MEIEPKESVIDEEIARLEEESKQLEDQISSLLSEIEEIEKGHQKVEAQKEEEVPEDAGDMVADEFEE